MLKDEAILTIIRGALKEDIGRGDITSSIVIPPGFKVSACIYFKEDGVLCGADIAETVFSLLSADIRIKVNAKDGDFIEKGKAIIYLEGPANAILSGERVALNFLGHLSGIATKTRMYADKLKPFNVMLMDTRKTTPNLRILEKYAVKSGGGHNHRFGLFDQVLIKDNHLAILKRNSKNKIKPFIESAVKDARKKVTKNVKVEIEISNLEEFKKVLSSNPDIIMLDNMPPAVIKEAVILRNTHKPKILLEASGGITLDNISEYAKTGVDMISVGALTHSVKSIDVSLEIVG